MSLIVYFQFLSYMLLSELGRSSSCVYSDNFILGKEETRPDEIVFNRLRVL
jgi:hypothetical protein